MVENNNYSQHFYFFLSNFPFIICDSFTYYALNSVKYKCNTQLFLSTNNSIEFLNLLFAEKIDYHRFTVVEAVIMTTRTYGK